MGRLGKNSRFYPRAKVERSVLPQGCDEMGKRIEGVAGVERSVLPQSGGRTVGSTPGRG